MQISPKFERKRGVKLLKEYDNLNLFIRLIGLTVNIFCHLCVSENFLHQCRKYCRCGEILDCLPTPHTNTPYLVGIRRLLEFAFSQFPRSLIHLDSYLWRFEGVTHQSTRYWRMLNSCELMPFPTSQSGSQPYKKWSNSCKEDWTAFWFQEADVHDARLGLLFLEPQSILHYQDLRECSSQSHFQASLALRWVLQFQGDSPSDLWRLDWLESYYHRGQAGSILLQGAMRMTASHGLSFNCQVCTTKQDWSIIEVRTIQSGHFWM